MSAGYGYDPEEDSDEQKRPEFQNPALALDQQPPALPDERPALALASDERGGGSPTSALALQQPDENAVDAVTGLPGGGQPAAQPEIPGGALTPEQEAAASTVPLNPADPIDQELAKAGQGTGKPLTNQEQVQKTMGEQDKLLEEQIDAKKRADAAQAKINEEQAKFAAQQAQIEQAHAQQQQQIVAQANARTQQWMDRQQAEMDKFQHMGLHDYWADKGVGNKILAGLAVAFGAVGGRSAAQNPGLQIINGAIDRDFRMQQAGILKQREQIGMAKEGVEASLSYKQQQLADNNLKKAAAYEAVAAQGVAMKLRQGVPLAEANNDAAIVSLRQAAAQTRMETLKAVHTQNIQDAQVDISRQKLLADKERADAAMLSAQARAHKGHGGGGPGRSQAVEDFTAAVNQLKPGEQIPPRVMALGIKAGYTANQVPGAIDKIRNSGAAATTAAGRAEKGGAGGGTKEVTDDFKTVKERAIGTAKSAGPVKTLATIEAVRGSLEDAINSGQPGRLKAATIKAMEQAGSLMSGGKLTNAQIQILHELESAKDAMTSKIGYWTGNPAAGRGLVKRLMDLIDDAGNEQSKLIGQVREDAYGQNLGPGGTADTPEKKRRFLNLAKGTFGSVKWQGKKLFNEQGGAGGQKLSNRDRALKVKATQTINDPNADAQAKKDAQALVDYFEAEGLE